MVASACSWLVVTPAAEPPAPPGDCTTSQAAPTFDLIGAVAGTAGAAIGAKMIYDGRKDFTGHCTGDGCGAYAALGLFVLAPSVVVAITYALSARSGYRMVDRCRRLKAGSARDEASR